MPGQASNARQVSSLGESPAQARRRMEASGGGSTPQAETRPPAGESRVGPTPKHMAAMREQEGFSGGPVENGTVEEAEETTAAPSPDKAMEMIQQLSQDKLTLQSERDAAINKLQRYEARFGEID